jgi:NDP-sugar pyrophosphorylase family protein
MHNAEKTQVAILAGGLGTRLRPYTETIPKPMIDINGKPFLSYKLAQLKEFGIREVLLCTGYLGNIIEDYFGNGGKIGMNLSYSHEKEPLGTAGAIKNAEHLVTSDPFILMNGDTYMNLNLLELLSFHFKEGFPLTMAVSNATNPREQELIEIENGTVSAFYKRGTNEHTNHIKENKSPLINSGVYVMSKKIFPLIPSGRKCSLENEIFPYFKGVAAGFFWEGYMKDLATMQFCKEFEQDLIEGKNK